MLSGCSEEKSRHSAEQYKLELQYYQFAMNFLNLNMSNESETSCKRTVLLRNECFTTLVQKSMEKNLSLKMEWCYEIHPEEKMPMTMNAFSYVYTEMDKDLKNELKEKISPSRKRIATLQKIREECLKQLK